MLLCDQKVRKFATFFPGVQERIFCIPNSDMLCYSVTSQRVKLVLQTIQKPWAKGWGKRSQRNHQKLHPATLGYRYGETCIPSWCPVWADFQEIYPFAIIWRGLSRRDHIFRPQAYPWGLWCFDGSSFFIIFTIQY